MVKPKVPLCCSFCGKSDNEVRKLIAGPTVFICDECVELCVDILKQEVGVPEMAVGDLGLQEEYETLIPRH